jgi:limonene-1,2-epoxide hydrolase
MQTVDIVDTFLHAYFGQEAEATLRLITDDLEWISMYKPDHATRGRVAMHNLVYERNFGFPEPFSDGHHRTVSALHSGDLVLHERVDYFTMRGRQIEVPCCAKFRLRDGKISVWHDYFDMGLVVRQMLAAGVALPSGTN